MKSYIGIYKRYCRSRMIYAYIYIVCHFCASSEFRARVSQARKLRDTPSSALEVSQRLDGSPKLLNSGHGMRPSHCVEGTWAAGCW